MTIEIFIYVCNEFLLTKDISHADVAMPKRVRGITEVWVPCRWSSM